MLGATIQSVIATVTRRLEFVSPCTEPYHGVDESSLLISISVFFIHFNIIISPYVSKVAFFF